MKRNLIFLGYNRIVDLIISEVKFEKLQIVIISDSNQLAKCTRKHSEVIYLISSKQELKKNINKYYSGDEDLIISVGCPWILSQSNLNQFNNRVLNLHGTHLPMYREIGRAHV